MYQLCFQMLAVVLLIATKKKQQQEERDGRTSNPMMRMTSLLSKENQTRVSTIYVGEENCIFYFAQSMTALFTLQCAVARIAFT